MFTIQQIRTFHENAGGTFFKFNEGLAHPLRKSIECKPIFYDGRIFLVTACKPVAHGKRYTLSLYHPDTNKIEACGKEHGFLTREGAIGAITQA